MANLKEVKDPIIWASLKTTSHHFVWHVIQDDSPDSATAIKPLAACAPAIRRTRCESLHFVILAKICLALVILFNQCVCLGCLLKVLPRS